MLTTCDHRCGAVFTLNDGNSIRHIYEQDSYLRWVETFCPVCRKGYRFFINRNMDTALAENGVTCTMEPRPPMYIRRQFNRLNFPDVVEKNVQEFVRELQSI